VHSDWFKRQVAPCYELERERAQSPFLLVCEHASKFIPAHLCNLGLDEAAATSHIAWDIGALDVARSLSAILDATLIFQKISRLVYDCNRPHDAPSAMPDKSEIYRVPGNENLADREKFDRLAHVYIPFHQAVDRQIIQRRERGQETIFIAIHSFTPVFHGVRRDCEIGFLYDLDDAVFGRHLLAQARASGHFNCRENEPYGPQDGQTMHTIRLHARQAKLKNVMVEMRHDLIDTDDGVKLVSDWLAGLLKKYEKGEGGGFARE